MIASVLATTVVSAATVALVLAVSAERLAIDVESFVVVVVAALEAVVAAVFEVVDNVAAAIFAAVDSAAAVVEDSDVVLGDSVLSIVSSIFVAGVAVCEKIAKHVDELAAAVKYDAFVVMKRHT